MKKYFDNISKFSKEEILSFLSHSLKEEKKQFCITANPETFMNARYNEIMNDILLNKDNLLLVDGIGIVLGSKIEKVKIGEKYPGVELVSDLLEELNKIKGKLYVYGSKELILKDFESVLKKKFKNIDYNYKNGYDYKDKDFYNDIKKYKPDLILVALGIPKQEQLIGKYFDKVDKGIFIGVGGSIDVLSGNKKRAPKFFRKLNIEWLYRIFKEPKRIGRFIKNNIGFLFLLMKGGK